MNEHAICMNCAHWDLANAVQLPVYQKGRLVFHREYAPCKANAVEADAGDCLPMMGQHGHCRFHEDAFRPAADFLAFEHEAEHENDGLPVMQLDPAALRPASHVAA